MPLQALQAFFGEPINTLTYLVSDPATRQTVAIDHDHGSGKASAASADRVLDAPRSGGLTVAWVLETHAHAYHLSTARYIRQRTGAQVAIGEHIRDAQTIFRPGFNFDDMSGDGSEFDRLLKDGETLRIGCVRRDAPTARRHPGGTHNAAAVDPGQHPGWPTPPRRIQRRALPQDPHPDGRVNSRMDDTAPSKVR